MLALGSVCRITASLSWFNVDLLGSVVRFCFWSVCDPILKGLQAGRAGKRKWDQPAPSASSAGNAAPLVTHPPLPAAQQAPTSPPLPAPYPLQPTAPQPPYQDPQMQQPGYSQPYQHHSGSMGMQSMATSSFGMLNSTLGTPGTAPWQTQAAQQQPWGMGGGQAPVYGHYPQPGMGSMTHQTPGKPPCFMFRWFSLR